MKKIIFIILLLPLLTKAQYTGGFANGSTIALINAANISMPDSTYTGGTGNGYEMLRRFALHIWLLDSTYSGGSGNGFYKTSQSNLSISFNDSLYTGGTGNGFDKKNESNISLSFADSLYTGGSGNGFEKKNKGELILWLQDSIYLGGEGKGDVSLEGEVRLDLCVEDQLTWNGNQNTFWSNPNNWDCGVIPTIKSIVNIPSGMKRYPTILSNITIKQLWLYPEAKLIISPPIGRLDVKNP